MHVELVVPALFHCAGRRARPRSSCCSRAAAAPMAQAAIAGSIGWAARSASATVRCRPARSRALAGGLDPGAGHWLRADPVHLRADRDRVLLIPSAGIRASPRTRRRRCAAALNRHFAGQFTLHAVAPGPLGPVARDRAMRAARARADRNRRPRHRRGTAGQALACAAERNPDGALRAPGEHGARSARRSRGQQRLALGRGRRCRARRSGPWQSVSADDPVALGLARLAGMRHRAPGAGAAAWLERAPEDGRHLVVLDGLRGAHALGDAEALAARALQELERNWFAPLLAALRAGRIGMLTVHVPDAGASFETRARRPAPLLAPAAAAGELPDDGRIARMKIVTRPYAEADRAAPASPPACIRCSRACTRRGASPRRTQLEQDFSHLLPPAALDQRRPRRAPARRCHRAAEETAHHRRLRRRRRHRLRGGHARAARLRRARRLPGAQPHGARLRPDARAGGHRRQARRPTC